MILENDVKESLSPLGPKDITTASCGADAAPVQNDMPVSSQGKSRCSSNSLRVNYRIIALAGNQPVIVLDSGFELPHATEPEFIPLADASCSKLFELLVVNPLQTGIRAFLQRRFNELRAQAGGASKHAGGALSDATDSEEAPEALLNSQHRPM